MRIKWCKAHNSSCFFLKESYMLLGNSCLSLYCGDISKTWMEYI